MNTKLILFGIIFLTIIASFTLAEAETVCYDDVSTLPVTCTGGTITQDTVSGSCRTILCSSNNDSLQVSACDKSSPARFEMYKQEKVGTSVSKICLGTTCISNDGFASQNFPVCVGEITPPIDNEDVDVSLTIAPWYPKGNDYVLLCEAQGFTPTSYDWLFGDGNKQVGATNNNVYHTYNDGSYDVTCIAKSATEQETGTLRINVGAQNPPTNETGNQTNQTATCYNNVQDLPVNCSSWGIITSDTFDGCRYVTCSDATGNYPGEYYTAKACDKPGSNNPTTLELYSAGRQGFAGTEICFGGACISSGKPYKSYDYPLCGGNTAPPVTENNSNNSSVAYTSVKDIPATCVGGTITHDSFNGGRSIICENEGKMLSVTAWNKPDKGTPQYFEMYKFLENPNGDSGLKICLLSTCISTSGFARSLTYPLYGYGPGNSNETINNTNSTIPINGTTNTTNTTTNVSVNFSISPDGGFFSNNVNVIVTKPVGHKILYTLDGSNPLENSILLSGSTIAVQKRSDAPSSFATNPETSLYPFVSPSKTLKGTVLRIAELDATNQSIMNMTRIYFIGLETKNFTLPVFSVVLEDEYLQGYEDGMFVKGSTYYNNLNASSSEPPNPFSFANWNNDSKRFPCWVETYVNNTRVISDNVMCYPSGRWSAALAKKTLKLKYDKDVGAQFTTYEFFGDESPSSMNKIWLKNGGQDFDGIGMRDCIAAENILGLNVEETQCTESILFINGEFYGVMNINQDIDAKYLAERYGISKDDVVLLEQDGLVEEGKKADNKPYFALKSWVTNSTTDLSDNATWQNFTSQVNIDSLIDHMIVQIYVNNQDYPNDYRMWRNKNAASQVPGTPYDGRWYFQPKDLDQSAGLYPQIRFDDNTVNRFLSQSSNEFGYFLFIAAMNNPEFKQKFISRSVELADGQLNSAHWNQTIDRLAAERRIELSKEIQRWNKPTEWENQLVNLKNWYVQRGVYFKAQILALNDTILPSSNPVTVSVAAWYPKVRTNTTDYVFLCNPYSNTSSYDWYTYKNGIEVSKIINQVSNSVYKQYVTGTGSYVQMCVVHDGSMVTTGNITVTV